MVLQSELVANEPLPAGGDDPRAAAVPDPLVGEYKAMHDHSAVLVHSTGRSLLRTAAGMDHVIEGPSGVDVDIDIERRPRPGDGDRGARARARRWC